MKKIKLADELPRFKEMARLLYVPQPDKKTGVIEQFDDYYQTEGHHGQGTQGPMLHPNFEYLGAGQGLAVPTKVIKQADVVMMLNLFKDRYSKEIKKANWEYYEPRTEHGSSLSACAYAMVATEFGNLNFAYKYFLKTAKIDIEAKYKVFVGTIFMGGSHPAANGGAWMTAVLGFGGVQAVADHVIINPRLYKKWQSLQFNLVYKGDHFNIKITRNEVAINANAANRRSHKFVVSGKAVHCAAGKLSLVKC